MSMDIKNFVNWLKDWFYDKDEVDNLISIASSGDSGDSIATVNMTLVPKDTDNTGAINISAVGDSVDTTLSTTSTKAIANSTVTTNLNNKISKTSTDNGFLKSNGDVDNSGGLMTSTEKTKLSGLSNYSHPSSKQCSYAYTHPSAKQCNASIPSKTSDLTNDSGFLTSHQSLKTINNESLVGTGNINIPGGSNVTVDSALSSSSENPVQNKVIKSALDGKADTTHTHNQYLTSHQDISGKQDQLVSGTNIKTINNQSLLGSGNITISGGSGSGGGISIDDVYPIGAIYMSVNSANPSTLFGGTWEQIEDRFLLASGSSYTCSVTDGVPTNTGGEAEHTLTKDELPSFTHTISRIASNSSASQYLYKGSSTSVQGTKVSTISSSFSHGSNGAHNNMPPYIVVNVWVRTA